MIRASSSSFAFLIGLCACGVPVATPAPTPAAPAPAAPPSAEPTVATLATAAPTATPAPPVEPAAPVVSPDAAATTPPAAPAPAVVDEAPPPASAELKAFVTGPLLGTEVVFITVAGATETCATVASKAPPQKGARRFDLRVLWQPGYYDFSNRMAEAKMGTYEGTFWLKEAATQGGVQVRAAPTKQGTTGRIHVKASRPGSAQAVDAELDVAVCADVAPKKRTPGPG